ncbi:unnamed protein product [marine sediment metagenome]|uniref:Uncharacterized protein n=1 Tax=marine sediment metagenome TaxID=412755 RepID=X1C5G7_9ZZZZ
MDEVCKDTDLSHQEVYVIIDYWRKTSKYYWDEISKDTESVIRDWEIFVNNLNSTYEVYFLVSSYQKEFGRWIWYQPDFEDKETRDNRLIHKHIKGMFTRLDEMALMGEEVSATRLPAIEAVEALKAFLYIEQFVLIVLEGDIDVFHGYP